MKGKGYVLTVSDKDGTPNPGFWEYDPTLNVWSRLTDFGHGDGNAVVGFAIDEVISGGLGISATGEQNENFGDMSRNWNEFSCIPLK